MNLTEERPVVNRDLPAASASICDLFSQQAAATPSAVALSSCGDVTTYAELEQFSNRLGRYLKNCDVSAEDLIVVCLERDVIVPAVFLAILKASAAYLPVEPGWPDARIGYCIQDAASKLVITHSSLSSRFKGMAGVKVIEIDTEAEAIHRQMAEPLPTSTDARSLAYVMYTSGSTGNPKGVAVEHGPVVSLVKQTNYAAFDSSETYLMLAPCSFDASTLEIWAPLLNGGRLAIHPAGVPSLDDIAASIAENQVTTLWLTAGLFHRMVDYRVESLRPLRQLLAGGDALSAPHVRRALSACPGLTVINGYGPTENTTFTTCHRMTAAEQVTDNVALGTPVSQTEVFILGDDLLPVESGEAGEIYIGGTRLARGYLNLPEMTAQTFLWRGLDCSVKRRLYKTGDMGRFRADGLLEFLGRKDRQVKISGHRIEPGEIEAGLRSIAGVRDAAVCVVEGARREKHIEAFVVAEDRQALSESGMRAALREKLPEPQIPRRIHVVAELPLTANGKVDRNRLTLQSSQSGSQPKSPEDFAGALAAIWRKVLGVEEVDRSANFFDLGGTSLHLIDVHAELAANGYGSITMVDLFQYPKICDLAKKLMPEANRPSVVAATAGMDRRRAFQQRQMKVAHSLQSRLEQSK